MVGEIPPPFIYNLLAPLDPYHILPVLNSKPTSLLQKKCFDRCRKVEVGVALLEPVGSRCCKPKRENDTIGNDEAGAFRLGGPSAGGKI